MSRCRGLAATVALVSLTLLPAACGSSAGRSQSGSRSITLYTCVNDTTIGPVVDAYERAHPGTKVGLYRAPTGDLNARVAGDVRSGGLRADVVWACDPLTMQDYVMQGLVGGWTPRTAIPSKYRTSDYVGAALLYMVAVTGKGVPAPSSWSDLTGSAYRKGVAVPDPAVAASALGTLGYFSAAKGYGVGFYARLKANGATQVSTPDDVVSGVAEGRYAAGVSIASSAYAAKQNGSPIQVTWPRPGAVAVYGPVALAKDTKKAAVARSFISFVTGHTGQEVLAKAGSYPTWPGVAGPTKPVDAPVVSPDWSSLSAKKDRLLAQYQKIFGG